MRVRAAQLADSPAIWTILKPVIRAAETYTLPADWTSQQTIGYWFSADHSVFVAEESGSILGTYFLRANHRGGGSHVANCGYVTAAEATGRGVARSMCAHSLDYAKHTGYLAMQFNFVVSTNERAVGLWKSMGFAIVGTLPEAFRHPSLGLVDAFIMYCKL